jgi:alpha-glucosidase
MMPPRHGCGRWCTGVCVALAVCIGLGQAQGSGARVTAPDNAITVHVQLDAGGRPTWRIDYHGRPVIVPSPLGFVRVGDDEPPQWFITGVQYASYRDTWRPVYGERAEVPDVYAGATIDLVERADSHRRMTLEVRVYDHAAALRHHFAGRAEADTLHIGEERTMFGFAADHAAWAVYSAQGRYERVPLSRIKPNCERPLVIEIEGGPVVAVGEAALVDFARMRLRPAPPYGVQAMLGSDVKVNTPYTTPWRVVTIADTPGELIENNFIFENLNAPCAIDDPSWIKPGKVIREVTLTTAGGKACVDFARRMNLQYVEYDAGWYGPENDENADATTVTLDPNRSKGPLDLPEVIRYAKANGIGIWLYVNHRALERQLDEVLPLYERWGIAGVKYGFVQVGDQRWTAWLHEAVRKAADHHLMVDIHDEYRPTGYSRTYPNLLTQEGIGGNETMPPPEQNLVYPFTRYLCGAADYTICWMDRRIQGTRAHQMAAAVVYYSPLQFVFWYDRPQNVPDDSELEFFRQVPTVWDETHVLDGQIGQYITTARRSGDQWFVGTMNAVTRRSLEVPLAFLPVGRAYTAHVYADARPEGGDRAVRIETQPVTADTVLTADLAANGGQAIWIEPVD